MGIVIGLVISVVSMVGSFIALGGKVSVLWQPWELVILVGSSVGAAVVGQSGRVLKDMVKGIGEAFAGKAPSRADYTAILSVLFSYMRDLKSRGRNEVEAFIEDPETYPPFQRYPKLLRDQELRQFICDYLRLIATGNVRGHDLDALMDEDLVSLQKEMNKPYEALSAQADALPALGIVAAVLGVIKALGAIDQSPVILGSLIGAALVGTFAGVFLSYALMAPLAVKVKTCREKRLRQFIVVRQTLVAFVNGSTPQIAIEYGRKTISAYARPTIDELENEALAGSGAAREAQAEAA